MNWTRKARNTPLSYLLVANFTSTIGYIWTSRSVLMKSRLSRRGVTRIGCIDDLGIWKNETFDEHLELINHVLQRMTASNLKANPLNYNWGVIRTDFLGYEMTPTSCKPMNKKIGALLKMNPPAANRI